jgi:hypothetical protein
MSSNRSTLSETQTDHTAIMRRKFQATLIEQIEDSLKSIAFRGIRPISRKHNKNR